jgi:hypothetical protein
MKHIYGVLQDQVEAVKKLVEAIAPWTGGKVEMVQIIQVVTEDERLAAVLDNLLGNNFVKKRPWVTEKVWTIFPTRKRISAQTLGKYLRSGQIGVGAELEHCVRGNYVVVKDDKGELIPQKVVD